MIGYDASGLAGVQAWSSRHIPARGNEVAHPLRRGG